MKQFLTALAVCATVALSACSKTSQGAESKTLRFTAIPNTNNTQLEQKFQPVAEYLSKQLGVNVEYVPAADYVASIEMFKNGDVHLAWFGGLTGVRARRAVAGAHAIAQGVADPEYKSYFIANPASGIEPGANFPMGLAGQTFTFGSESSTSGRLMPEYFIRQATSKSPEAFFGHANKYSGSHDKTWEAVQTGAVMSGALDYKQYDQDLAAGKIDPALCRIVWTTPVYPDYSWNAHPDVEKILGEGGTKKLQDALLGMKTPELLAAIARPEGLIPAKDADFDALVGLAEELGLLR